MSEIFISYAREDRERARQLVGVLVEWGWSVWWDPHILPGASFDDVIEEALKGARCVIVLWSKQSVSARWVRTEAAEGAARGILIPVLLEKVDPPLEFRRIQAADLSDWEAGSAHPELQALLRTVRDLLGIDPDRSSSSSRAAGVSGRTWWQRSKRAVLGTIGMICILLVFAVRRWQVPPAQDASFEENAVGKLTPGGSQPGAIPAAPIAGRRINLIAPENGGHLVSASHSLWDATIDGREEGVFTNGGSSIGEEAVYAFKDERPATFDTFTILIAGSGENIKQFELLAGEDLTPAGFRSIGRFQTDNALSSRSPYQQFTFPAVTARYLKFKLISSYSAGYALLTEFQLFGLMR